MQVSKRFARRRATFIGGLLLAATALVSPLGSAAAGQYIAADHFIRNISNGWGSAQPGGTYTVQGPATDYWVSTAAYARGVGYIRVPRPGVSRGALLPQAVATNVEVSFSVYITAPDRDGPYFVYAVMRSMGSNEIRARIVYNRDCSVSTNASIVVSGRERPMAAARTVPGAWWCGSSRAARTVSLRAQLTGTSPTSVRIKAWPASAGGEASNWLWSASTPTSLVSSRPSVGLRAYASSTASKNPVDFVFYNWTARSI